jgi:uncharacterized protein YdeI (YjbR/CyaY-like superfamily)
MKQFNSNVDNYLQNGCGRCPLVGTPQCKVRDWTKELTRLRSIVLGCDLVEEVKWGVPCYTFDKHNVVIISALRECCTLSFFKGALLADAHGVLEKPGENSQAARLFRLTSVREIAAREPIIKQYIREAIELEKAGAKVEFTAKSKLTFPAELEMKFDALPALRAAFAALTPGRQRGYVLYFSGAKQSKTRESRIEKCIPAILEGRGLHD